MVTHKITKSKVTKTGRKGPSAPATLGNKDHRYGCGGKIKK